MSPTRRTLLRTGALAAAAPLAGCTRLASLPADPPFAGDGASSDGNGNESGSDSGSTGGLDSANDSDGPGDLDGANGLGGGDRDAAGDTRLAGTGGPGVTLVGVDDAPALPTRPSVTVTRPVATEEHPPRLRVTVTNEGDDPVSVGEARSAFFEHVGDDGDRLRLLPTDGDYPAEPGCWRLSGPIAVTAEYGIVSLAPGESASRLVDLYAAPGVDACLPVGEFRFETTYSVWSGDGLGSDPDARAAWGFALVLE